MTLLLLAALLVAWPGPAAAAVPSEQPSSRGRVVDQAGVLRPGEAEALEKRLAALQAAHGIPLAVLVVPTTGAEGPERYAARVREEWKLGQPGRDDGLLLLVARDDRQARIDAGAGVSARFPEDVTSRILLEELAPLLRQGAYAAGIQAALNPIGRILGGEALAPPPEDPGPAASDDASEAILGAAVVVAVIGLLLRFVCPGWLAGLLTLLPMVGLAVLLPDDVGLIIVLGLAASFVAFVVHRIVMGVVGMARGEAPGGRRRGGGRR